MESEVAVDLHGAVELEFCDKVVRVLIIAVQPVSSLSADNTDVWNLTFMKAILGS